MAEADSFPTQCGVLEFANVSIHQGDAYNYKAGIFTCHLDGI